MPVFEVKVLVSADTEQNAKSLLNDLLLIKNEKDWYSVYLAIGFEYSRRIAYGPKNVELITDWIEKNWNPSISLLDSRTIGLDYIYKNYEYIFIINGLEYRALVHLEHGCYYVRLFSYTKEDMKQVQEILKAVTASKKEVLK